MVFGVPKGMKVKEADRLKAERLGYPSDELRNYTRLGNSCWYTNLDHGRRHAPLQFMSMADNVKFSRHKEVRGIGYLEYDNFDAIEVPFVDAIPGDYEGVMAVPVSYLDKHNPDQFEVVGITRAWSGDATKVYPKQFQIDPNGQKSTVTKLNDSGAIKVDVAPPDKTYYMVGDETFIKMFARILIQRKNVAK
jgi:hypothetical protein